MTRFRIVPWKALATKAQRYSLVVEESNSTSLRWEMTPDDLDQFFESVVDAKLGPQGQEEAVAEIWTSIKCNFGEPDWLYRSGPYYNSDWFKEGKKVVRKGKVR